MSFFKKEVPPQQKTPGVQIPEHDQLDVLRHLWLARLLDAAGDEKGAALCRSYAALADAYNEAKYWYKLTLNRQTGVCSSPDWEHRFYTLKDQLRNERVFWRNLQPDDMVAITQDPKGFWPTDAELLAGA